MVGNYFFNTHCAKRTSISQCTDSWPCYKYSVGGDAASGGGGCRDPEYNRLYTANEMYPSKFEEKGGYYSLLHSSECNMARYFTSKHLYFHEPKMSENIACE